MSDNNIKINELLARLNVLSRRQEEFSKELNNLRSELQELIQAPDIGTSQTSEFREVRNETPKSDFELAREKYLKEQSGQPAPEPKPATPVVPRAEVVRKPHVKTDFEKFIGENLINKIGIAITVIGVAIGAKYAIDHQLISPLTRIILGYLVGGGLLGFAIKLKKNYDNFSAVLLSGAMAIMYFITYAAYSFYGLFPQTVAFILMVLFTAFTVVAAINYNKQVIAHIGLVGAYAVPFLLSEGSGKVAVLFTYMAIINIGILSISFKRDWKPLYYSAFGLTWLIYLSWYNFSYEANLHFTLALVFQSLFFFIFYLTVLGYKLVKKEKYEKSDIFLLLANSFLFYGLGYSILSYHPVGKYYLGLFTLINAIVHFIVSVVIYRQKLADRNLFYLVAGLVLVFITIAIPVQLNGSWVTLLWAGEAAVLFWIGRTKKIPVYEKLSYPVMFLALLSIIQDWTSVYSSYSEDGFMPLLNIHFLSSILFIAAFGFIYYLNKKEEFTSAFANETNVARFVNFALPVTLLFLIYFSLRLEISAYWDQLYENSQIEVKAVNKLNSRYYWNHDYLEFGNLWVLNYSLLFVATLAFLNLKKIKNATLDRFMPLIIIYSLLCFLFQGLMALSELRESYLEQTFSEYYKHGLFNLVIRYVSYLFVAVVLIAAFQHSRRETFPVFYKQMFDFTLHATILWIASSELIHWMDLSNASGTYKLGLSILWGVYSLCLVVIGIWKRKKHLRVGAIAFFGVTLLKVFFYDLVHLNTISKTIVFVSLGILLLIISFLYNKYKHVIADEVAD